MKNQKETIRKMVRELQDSAKEGGFCLPNIQRSFVWGEDRIERLFDSILREYPIGTLLVWKTKASVRRRPFISNYKSSYRPSSDYLQEDNKLKQLVLDGQQRLQSLLIGLCGSYDNKALCFNVLSGEAKEPDDIKYSFRFLHPKETAPPWFLFESIVFSNTDTYSTAKKIIGEFSNSLSPDERDKIHRHAAQVTKVFTTDEVIVYQELDSIDSPELYSENDVVEVFIRANSGGTPLGRSDLLFSLLISEWNDADIEIDELLDQLNAKGYGFTRDFVMKTCLTLLDKGAKYEVDKFRLSDTRQRIQDNWKDISDAIRDVQDYLYGSTFVKCHKALPSYLGLIPVIYFRYHFPAQWKQQVKGLPRYLVTTLLTGTFNAIPDTLIDACVSRIKEEKDFCVESVFEAIRGKGRNLELTTERLLGAGYGSDVIHLLFNLWYDFNYAPAYQNNMPQVDHIFPQSLLKTVKVTSQETKRQVLKYRDDARNQLANCMLLTAEENGPGGKSDTPPNQWFQGKPADYLERHLIPPTPELWELDQFENFIKARKELILKRFANLLTQGSKAE